MMVGKLTIDFSAIATWAPILISLMALSYSRRAFRYQVKIKQREHIAIVNLRLVGEAYRPDEGRDRPALIPGVLISNESNAPLDNARILYYHRRFGRWEAR